MIHEFLSTAPRKVYAGVGSRDTPADVLDLMARIARKLEGLAWTLRSGGADGADDAFERGALWTRRPMTEPEIFLPWPGFRGRWYAKRTEATIAAREIATSYHPNWAALSSTARKLHARNVHQVLGADLNAPASFVLCWTPDGATTNTTSRTRGTGQAIRIAVAYGVPVFNLRRDDHRAAWTAWAEGT